MYVVGYNDIGATVGTWQSAWAVGPRRGVAPHEVGGKSVDTLELDPRLRHASGFLGRPAQMLINGKLVPAASGKTFEVYNPATGAVIANVPEADKQDVDIAVAAARRAFDDGRWAKVSR
jgi:hypothetical protein